MSKVVSIIMPCRNEGEFISDAIESVIEADFGDWVYELLVVDGCSDDGTRERISCYADQHDEVSLLDNEFQTAPHAMNIGIQHAKGSVIIRIDAHCIYPREYFLYLLEQREKLNADNVGTVLTTASKTDSSVGHAIAAVLSDKFGVGNSQFRTGVSEITEADTVPFGCFPKSVFDRVGVYDTRLQRSQDFELNSRIRAAGGKIYLLPDYRVTYFARDTFMKLASKYVQNGMWNILTAFYTGRLGSLSIRNYAPTIALIAGLLLVVAGLYSSVFFYIAAGACLLYAELLFHRSGKITPSRSSRLHIVIAFAVLHFSHALGGVLGLCSLLLPRHWRMKGKRDGFRST